jgi:hypothetical protein
MLLEVAGPEGKEDAERAREAEAKARIEAETGAQAAETRVRELEEQLRRAQGSGGASGERAGSGQRRSRMTRLLKRRIQGLYKPIQVFTYQERTRTRDRVKLAGSCPISRFR